MPEQYQPNLGGIPDEAARRDAVHIAVAPVIAAMPLSPGFRVGLDRNGRAWFGEGVEYVGIVDPFLNNIEIEEGQRFWLFLYPNTVTSLRHVWTHPAFATSVPPLGGQP